VPVENLNRYTCSITGEVELGLVLPPRWFEIEGEVFSPRAQQGIAQFVVDHPGIGFRELVDGVRTRPAALDAVKGSTPGKIAARTLEDVLTR
jgi:hypothetical protein